MLLNRLQVSRFLKHCAVVTASKNPEPAIYDAGNIDDCSYVLQTIMNLMIHSPGNFWSSLQVKHSLPRTSPAIGPEVVATASPVDDAEDGSTIVVPLIRICVIILGESPNKSEKNVAKKSSVRRTATVLLQQMLLANSSIALPYVDVEGIAIAALRYSIEQADTLLQISLMDLLVALLQARADGMSRLEESRDRRDTSGGHFSTVNPLTFSAERSEANEQSGAAITSTSTVLDCLLLGLRSPRSYPILEHWVRFLDVCLPFYSDNAFHLLMLVIECFNETIKNVFSSVRAVFDGQGVATTIHQPLSTLQSLFSGLERSLARAHEQLIQHEANSVALKPLEQSQGFFGNMVSGVFAAEGSRLRQTNGNSRLTVLLCFKGAIHVCLEIWVWGSHGQTGQSRNFSSSASLNHTSIRMKNRVRRILEHLFLAEPLECFETLIELWNRSSLKGDESGMSAILNLLHVLDASRPKNSIPALFNAIYSRTNPNDLDVARRSSLIADLSELTLANFLVSYMRSLEDDAMDEIWSDCMTFLKDVLANPLPHRQILPKLVEFMSQLGMKVDNTTFGEKRRMRRDFGVHDSCLCYGCC